MKTASCLLVGSVVTLGLVFCTACGNQKAAGPKTYPASVKILYRGQPLEGANVILVAQDPSGRGASGTTDANGMAKLGIAGQGEGAVPGKYAVTVSKIEGGQASNPNQTQEEFYKQQKSGSTAAPSSPKQALPAKYLSAQSSGLQCEVTEKADQVFEFNLGE
jgi:hypothetical protein